MWIGIFKKKLSGLLLGTVRSLHAFLTDRGINSRCNGENGFFNFKSGLWLFNMVILVYMILIMLL